MRKSIPLSLALLGAVLMMASPAKADDLNAFTQLTTSNWTPLPNATNRYSSGGGVYFQWLNGGVGKQTVIRVVHCNGDEVARTIVPANYGAIFNVGNVNFAVGKCFRVQGRMPNDQGNMANIHWYYLNW